MKTYPHHSACFHNCSNHQTRTSIQRLDQLEVDRCFLGHRGLGCKGLWQQCKTRRHDFNTTCNVFVEHNVSSGRSRRQALIMSRCEQVPATSDGHLTSSKVLLGRLLSEAFLKPPELSLFLGFLCQPACNPSPPQLLHQTIYPVPCYSYVVLVPQDWVCCCCCWTPYVTFRDGSWSCSSCPGPSTQACGRAQGSWTTKSNACKLCT